MRQPEVGEAPAAPHQVPNQEGGKVNGLSSLHLEKALLLLDLDASI